MTFFPRLSVLSIALLTGCHEPAIDRPETRETRMEAGTCPPPSLRPDEAALSHALSALDEARGTAPVTREVSVLGWVAERDDRLSVERSLLWIHERSNELPERWLLAVLVRNPHERWWIEHSLHPEAPIGIRVLEHAPSIAEAADFLTRARWTFLPSRGVRRTGAGVCRDAWAERLGSEPPASFAVGRPDRLTDEERRSLRYYAGPTTRIEGRVVDGEGRPVAGARVVPEVHPEDGCCSLSDRVTTDAEGRFALSIDPRQEQGYALRVTAPDGASRKRFLGAEEREVTIRLPRGSRRAMVVLRCTHGNRPDDATIRIYAGESRAREDLMDEASVVRWERGVPSSASARLLVPHGAAHVVVASACGTADVHVDAASPITISLPVSESHPLTLESEGRIGCVEVSSERYGAFQACTAESSLTLPGMAPGEYTISRMDGADPVQASVPSRGPVRLLPRSEP